MYYAFWFTFSCKSSRTDTLAFWYLPCTLHNYVHWCWITLKSSAWHPFCTFDLMNLKKWKPWHYCSCCKFTNKYNFYSVPRNLIKAQLNVSTDKLILYICTYTTGSSWSHCTGLLKVLRFMVKSTLGVFSYFDFFSLEQTSWARQSRNWLKST